MSRLSPTETLPKHKKKRYIKLKTNQQISYFLLRQFTTVPAKIHHSIYHFW